MNKYIDIPSIVATGADAANEFNTGESIEGVLGSIQALASLAELVGVKVVQYRIRGSGLAFCSFN